MSEKDCEESKCDTPSNSGESSTVDPELDIASDKFSPMRALKSPSFTLPVKNAKIFDNVAKFETHWKRLNEKEDETAKQGTRNDSKKRQIEQMSGNVRRFQPHQGSQLLTPCNLSAL